MVKIRLTRQGAKKRPYYRIVVMDERKARDGRPLEFLGTYDPLTQPESIETAADDRGRVIGRQGRVAKAMRAVLGASRNGTNVRLDIVD